MTGLTRDDDRSRRGESRKRRGPRLIGFERKHAGGEVIESLVKLKHLASYRELGGEVQTLIANVEPKSIFDCRDARIHQFIVGSRKVETRFDFKETRFDGVELRNHVCLEKVDALEGVGGGSTLSRSNLEKTWLDKKLDGVVNMSTNKDVGLISVG